MVITNELRSNVRASLRQHLALLGDLEAQRACAHFMSPTELICTWFDDFYHPDSPAHRQAFTTIELHALETFSNSFESLSAQLQEITDVLELQKRRDWLELSALATHTLAQIPEALPESPS